MLNPALSALLMVVTGVLTPRAAVRALDWNVLFILAGSVGLGAIVVESGIAERISSGITTMSAGSLTALIITLAVSTAILTNITTNAAAASILTPIGITLAASFNIDPVVLLALIGTCISFTFINPFSHQSNLMVVSVIVVAYLLLVTGDPVQAAGMALTGLG